jgi:glycosyltransferase involved in cell wall biosynthesis
LNNKKLSIIVPVYKAEKFIKKNLLEMQNDIKKTFPNFEIIAVIDGFVDESFKEAKKVPNVKVIGYKKNQGKGFALKKGFSECTGDFVTFVDCDKDINPEQLNNFLPYLSTADIVIGSKRHAFSLVQYPLIRKILSEGFSIYSRILLGISLKDTQTGLKLFKREVLEVILPLVVIKRYAFDLELCFLAQKHGFRFVEAPIKIEYQFSGTGIGGQSIFGMFVDVLAIRYRYTILKYYQKQYWKTKFGWEE